MTTVCSRWVIRNLSDVERRKRFELSEAHAATYDEDSEDFCSRVLTGDETWLHLWDPESKWESMQWKHMDSHALTKLPLTQRR